MIIKMFVMKKLYFILVIQLLAVMHLHAQNVVISGIVRDSTGPLTGATVAEKGLKSNGTVTNEEGRFSLTLKGTSKAILISSVGYLSKEVAVAGEAFILLSLEKINTGLEDV